MKASEQIKKIHTILDQYDGEEAVKRIREVMYGAPPPDLVEPGDDDEEKEESDG
jgi:hypothetical protein